MSIRNLPKIIGSTTAIPFDQPVSAIPQLTITGPVIFSKVTTGAQISYGAVLRVIANGSNIPDLSAFKKMGSGTYDNTNGVVNQLWFIYDGTDYCVAITQPVTISGTGDSTPPTIVSATAVNATTVQVVFSENVVATTAGWSVYIQDTVTTASMIGITGSGTTWNFTPSASMAAGQTLFISYNTGSGNTLDTAGNELGAVSLLPVTNSISGSFDADAQAFFDYITGTVGATLTTTEKNAVNQLVLDRKSASLWTKDIAIYPRVGSTVAAMGVNLKTPGTYSHSYTGSPATNAKGISWAGGTDWAELTGLDTVALGSSNVGMSCWFQTNFHDAYVGAPSGTLFNCYVTDATNLFAYPNIGAGSTGIAIPNLNNAGLLNTLQRKDATTAEYYRGTTLIGQDGTALNSMGTSGVNLTVHKFQSTICADSVVESMMIIHGSLSSTEQGNNNSSVSTFITALSR